MADARAELFGGYSRMSHHIGLNGWIVGADYAPWEHFALEGQISGHYGSGNILGVVALDNSIYDFNFGPRVFYDTSNEKVSVFGHFLLGGSHISGTTVGVSSSDSSFSWVLGGGADYSLSSATITILDDDLPTLAYSKTSIGLSFDWIGS